MLRTKTIQRLMLLLTLFLMGSTAACTQSVEEQQPVVTRDEDRRVTVEVSGARQARFDGIVKMHVVTRKGQKEQLPNSVAALNPMTPLQTGDGQAVNPEIGFVGGYRGDGSYDLPAGVGPPPTTGVTVAPPAGSLANSVAAVTFGPETPNAVRFGYVREPCKVRFSDDATVGSAVCPALVAPNGETVSMTFRWEMP